MNTTKNYSAWFLPLILLLIQFVQPSITLLTIAVLFLLCICLKFTRRTLLLYILTMSGYITWYFLSEKLTMLCDNILLSMTIGRFGLVGYIILFLAWHILSKTENHFFRWGNAKESIYFPFVWKGKHETISRFIIIFCGICLIPMIVAVLSFAIDKNILLYGLLFTIVNAALEEIIWRGFILARTIDFVGEKQALIISALSFGIYHISLGFPLWACLIFSVGGFYMGGATIVSKGLLPAFTMHVFVNMIFVLYGIIL